MARGKSASVRFSAVLEIPRKIRYQEDNSKTIVWDGTKTKASAQVSDSDEDLLESLFEDSMDGMVYTISQAKLFRPLMYRARLDDGKSKSYAGPYVDIFEIILPVPSKAAATVRQKHFYFNSQTELLDRVLYLSGPKGSVRVETRFQNWRLVNKTWVPGSITRAENGVDLLTFTVIGAEVGASQQDQTFLQP
jgi:hypothetical protein